MPPYASLRATTRMTTASATTSTYLRNLLFVPSATVIVAEPERRVVGVGVLAIRPSVRSGPFVGIVDELGIDGGAVLDAADRRRVADEIVEHLATSARNKGCTRVEVSEPLASAEPSLWKRLGFASRGRTLGRAIGPNHRLSRPARSAISDTTGEELNREQERGDVR